MNDSASLWLNSVRLAAILLTLLLAWVTYRSHLLLKQFEPPFNLLLSLPESLLRMGLVGLCLGLAWLSGLPAQQFGLLCPQPLQSIGLGLAVGLVVQVAVNGLTFWAIQRFGRKIYSPVVIRNILPRRPAEWVWVALAFIPAVVMEELLFRSLWLGLFQELIPLPLLIGVTSLLFGLMHQPQGLLGVITAGGLNILLCLLFIGTGELLPPLLAHYVINLLQVVAASRQREWLENYEYD
ncbi:MAG: CPBP family intramembrane metalloprotease [Anaerolineales bacterium]|nr:CPBP family intramembrane metalloprotease [Anaerolineales bacterium]